GAQRESARPHRADRGAAELFVPINGIRSRPEVEDDRAGHERDVHPLRRVAARLEELRGNAGRCLESVKGSAGEADRVDRVEMLPVHARRASTDVDRKRCHLRKMEHRAAGWAFLVLSDPYLESREVEL